MSDRELKRYARLFDSIYVHIKRLEAECGSLANVHSELFSLITEYDRLRKLEEKIDELGGIKTVQSRIRKMERVEKAMFDDPDFGERVLRAIMQTAEPAPVASVPAPVVPTVKVPDDWEIDCSLLPKIPDGCSYSEGDQIESRFKGVVKISKDVDKGRAQIAKLLCPYRNHAGQQSHTRIKGPKLLADLRKKHKVVIPSNVYDFLREHPEYVSKATEKFIFWTLFRDKKDRLCIRAFPEKLILIWGNTFGYNEPAATLGELPKNS